MKNRIESLVLCSLIIFCIPFSVYGQRQMEKLDRGLSAMYSSGSALVSWRIFGDDGANIAFNVYSVLNDEAPVLMNPSPISGKSNYMVSGINTSNKNQYYITPIIDGNEGNPSKIVTLKATSKQPYVSVPLDVPPFGGATREDVYTYSSNDCSIGDVDGDGDYEIIVKWDPSNSKDNAHSGKTGNVYLDAYTLEGEKLWRIDLGQNIRAGAHYTQFMVYDLDGDGKAEVACKTAPGAKDASGEFIKTGPAALANHTTNYANSSGRVLRGPEFLTLFNGQTGAEIITTDYFPPRHPSTTNPTGGQLDAIWGDNYGNRVDRFLACIAYLDGERPSLVMCRGYYTRTVLAAYDFRDGKFQIRWTFDSTKEGSKYEHQGNHGLTVADVDNDGKDEIIYGAMTIDNDGKGLYSTGLGHGDAMHVSNLDPSNPGLEVFTAHETGGNGVSYRSATDGEILWQEKKKDADIGRGVAFDIDPNYPGAECWASDGNGMYNYKGEVVTGTYPTTAGNGSTYNMAAWWDGDVLRELVDRTVITKWNWENKSTDRILSTYNYNVSSNNGTKSNPCLIADIWGDWREEIIYRSSDERELRIFSTPYPSDYGMYTLMHDPQYRLSIAWQNVAYNQPAHTGFFLGHDMATPPVPNAYYINANTPTSINTQKIELADFIYPNPVQHGLLSINTAVSDINRVVIKSLLGQTLYSENNLLNNRIDVSGFATGVYIIEIQTRKGGSKSQKVVIQ